MAATGAARPLPSSAAGCTPFYRPSGVHRPVATLFILTTPEVFPVAECGSAFRIVPHGAKSLAVGTVCRPCLSAAKCRRLVRPERRCRFRIISKHVVDIFSCTTHLFKLSCHSGVLHAISRPAASGRKSKTYICTIQWCRPRRLRLKDAVDKQQAISVSYRI